MSLNINDDNELETASRSNDRDALLVDHNDNEPSEPAHMLRLERQNISANRRFFRSRSSSRLGNNLSFFFFFSFFVFLFLFSCFSEQANCFSAFVTQFYLVFYKSVLTLVRRLGSTLAYLLSPVLVCCALLFLQWLANDLVDREAPNGGPIQPVGVLPKVSERTTLGWSECLTFPFK